MSGPDVPLADLEAAAELAREGGRSRLGRPRQRTARELLTRFGGGDTATRERATAALELAGVIAVPSLREADLDAPVTLRPREAPVPEAVPLDRRIRIGAVGLLALALLVAVALLLHHVVGGSGGQRASALPATATAPATTAPATTPSP